MGDHRFEFHATFKMHGIEEKLDLEWCNWSGGRHDIDRRITEWLEGSVTKAYNKFDEEAYEREKELKAAETEKQERAMLAQLKKKYE